MSKSSDKKIQDNETFDDSGYENKSLTEHMDEIKLAAENLLDIINNPYKPR